MFQATVETTIVFVVNIFKVAGYLFEYISCLSKSNDGKQSGNKVIIIISKNLFRLLRPLYSFFNQYHIPQQPLSTFHSQFIKGTGQSMHVFRGYDFFDMPPGMKIEVVTLR